MNTDSLNGKVGAVYTRVSTSEQSTEQQKSAIAEWLARKGLVVHPDMWFDDQGWSRAEADIRPAFQEMIALAKARKIGYIVCFNQDRFGVRDPYHLLEYLIPLHRVGCEVWSITQESMGNIAKPEVMPLILSTLNAATSETEINSKANRALLGLRRSAEDGIAAGDCPPYGFDHVCITPSGEVRWRLVWERYDNTRPIKVKIDADGRRTTYAGRDAPRPDLGDKLCLAPSVHGERIEAVRFLFNLFLDGHSPREILHRLAAARMPAVFRKGKWSEPQIRHMIANPVYWRGAPVRNRHSHAKHKQLRAEIETVEWEGGKHPPKGRDTPREYWLWPKNPPYRGLASTDRLPGEGIVTEQAWEDAYRRLIGRRGSPIAQKNPARWLSGVVVCGGCNKPMQVSPGPTRTGYCCSANRAVQRLAHADRPDPSTYCRMNFVSEWQAEATVKMYLDAAGQKLAALSEIPPAAILGMAEEYASQDPDLVLSNLLPTTHPVRVCILEAEALQKKYWGLVWQMLLEVKRAGRRPKDNGRPSIIAEYTKLYQSRLPGMERRLAAVKETEARMIENFAAITNPRQRAVAEKKLAEIAAEIESLEAQCSPLTATLEQVEQQLKKARQDVEGARREVLEGDATHLRQKAEALRRVVRAIVCRHRPVDRLGKRGQKLPRLESVLERVEVVPWVGTTCVFEAGEVNHHRPGVPPERRASRSSP
jgi:DNA invertase Pin-like site-specific DNA recombinase